MSENSFIDQELTVDFEADSTLDVQVGSVYQGASIDDNIISTKKTWSSQKINNELGTKADDSATTAALALKANSADVTTALASKANSADVYTKTETYSKAEVDAAIPSSASEISYDNTDSGLSATDVQTAIDEVNNKVPVVPDHYDADDIVYDNTTSELVSTDVQGAIDELVSSINALTNLGLNYTLVTIQSAEYTESTLPAGS